jgi:mono/diheme cytochrome c family protein
MIVRVNRPDVLVVLGCVGFVLSAVSIAGSDRVSGRTRAAQPLAASSRTTAGVWQADTPPGKAAYERVCRVCHGAEGRGDAGPSLVPFEMEYEELLAKVREGGGQMPPISEQTVSDREVAQIREYLKSLTTSDGSKNGAWLAAPGLRTLRTPEEIRKELSWAVFRS